MLKPYIRTISGDMDTPITIFRKYVGESKGFLLESKEIGKGRYSMISKNPFLIFKSREDKAIIEEKGRIYFREGNSLDIIKEYINKYQVDNNTELPFVGGAVGTVGYDTVRQVEVLPKINPDNLELPEVHQMFVDKVITIDHLKNKIHFSALDVNKNKTEAEMEAILDEMVSEVLNAQHNMKPLEIEEFEGKVESNVTEEEFKAGVIKAKEYIDAGDIFQVVLSQRVTVDQPASSFDIYRQLRQVNPSPYLYYLNFGEYQIAGSSPEMLVELKDNHIETCPIAGTRKRGMNDDEDSKIAEELLNDEKEVAEHVMLVDLGRNDMGRVAAVKSVNVKSFKKVKYYSHVMHIVSLVEGMKRDDLDMFDVLKSFLPAGTLSGAPKIRAMEIIEEIENTRRGTYGGAIGYFGFDKNMDMCIAIRTMIIHDNKLHLQAGAGIVADSVPESEYNETWNKLGALLSAIGIKA